MSQAKMSQADPAPARGFRITGWHVLAVVCGFFAIVIAVDVGMAAMAYRTFSGEVAADPYEAGRLYNRTLAERRAQAALGWTADVALLKGGDLQVSIKDRALAPVDGLKVSAVLERPATEVGRQALDFAALGHGAYHARTGHLGGAWDVRVRAVDAQGRPFEVEERFVWP